MVFSGAASPAGKASDRLILPLAHRPCGCYHSLKKASGHFSGTQTFDGKDRIKNDNAHAHALDRFVAG
jgi:hypothetical protein